MAEKLQRQETFRESYLNRRAKEIRLTDFDKKLTEKIDKKEDGEFTMFGGTFSSLQHALAEFELERFYYGKAVKLEQRFYEALKKDGLTDKQIQEIVTEGKYVKFVSEKQQKEEKESIDYAG
jgi:hypothetical protein